ncbi:MAG: hypothetical protein WC794_01020 [Candidatus Doudnabacteria bacterium]|jgi:K+-sensing histidine kinase KdpD
MIYFEIRNNKGLILATNIDSFNDNNLFLGNEYKNISVKNYKNVFKKFESGTVRLIGDKKDDLFLSKKIVSRTIQAYSEIINVLNSLKTSQESTNKIFFHNLITTHTRLQGEVETIISEDALIKCNDHISQIAAVKKSIQSNPNGVSESMLEVVKRVTDLQAQIEGLKMLSGEVNTDFGFHNIKRVLLNISYPFYNEFKKNNISLNINIDDQESENYKFRIDYKLFNVAMHHFFNNIVKYAKPYSHVRVNMYGETKVIEFIMHSIKINKEELSEINKLHVSGINVGDLAGDGVGMYMIKHALDRLGAYLEIRPNYSRCEYIINIPYVENRFLFNF